MVGGGRGWSAKSVVKGAETQAHAHGHGLAVVEAGVRGPARVEDVGGVEVGEEGAEDLGEGGEGEEGAGEHCFVWVGRALRRCWCFDSLCGVRIPMGFFYWYGCFVRYDVVLL